MKTHWLEQAKKRLKAEASEASAVPFDRLRAQGMIDDQGVVTGQLHRWNAFLAITELKHIAGRPQIEAFRCLRPVFGMPGSELIDISRDAMVEYLKEGKKVITAIWDDRLGLWKVGCDVHLSANGSIVCDSMGDGGDNVGSLPECNC